MDYDELGAEFDGRRNTPSDINEHLGKLADYAAKCHSVVEFGTRGGNSTVGLLRGLAASYFGEFCELQTVDIDPVATQLARDAFGERPAGIAFSAVTADTLKIEIETHVDMIFIDTLHTYHQLKQELTRHGNKAKKFLAFHDTYTFGDRGEDGATPGLNQAIDEFILNSLLRLGIRWERVYVSRANNGLTVLERIQAEPQETAVQSKFDEIETKTHAALKSVVDAGGAYEVGYTGKTTTLKVVWSVLIPGQEKPADFVYTAASDKGVAAALGAVTAVLSAHVAGLQKISGLLGV